MSMSTTQTALALNTARFCYEDRLLQISRTERSAVLDSRPLALRRKEYELLALLAANAGVAVPRAVLLMQVWGYGAAIRTRTLDVHILRLRKRLSTCTGYQIETVLGVGYRFQPARATPAPRTPLQWWIRTRR